MKKLSILLTLCVGISMQIFAQGVTTITSCNASGLNTIPARPTPTYGLTPSDSFLPCIIQGQPASDTIFFTNVTQVNVPGFGLVSLDSLTIDSIYLPSGLCWQTDSPRNHFAPGASGVILVTGTTTDSAGQYLLRIAFTGYAFGTHVTEPASSADLYYSVRVRKPACSCTPYVKDTTDAFIAFPSCTGAPTAAITPAGTDSICPGSSVTLTATSASGYTFKWSTGSTTDTIIVDASGSYTVKVYNNGDSATSAATTVVVRAAATAPTIADAGSGNSQVLTATGSTGPYQWYNGANAVSGATSATYTPTTNGSYTVQVTTACGTDTSNAVTVVGVGINEISGAVALRLYPNPSAGLFTLDAPGCAGSSYVITDELGRVVSRNTLTSESSLIDASSQKPGVYFLTVKNTQVNATVRFEIIK